MTLTTGAILRCITEADLSAASHKLATIILDGIAWKDGYNGLARGTAAFTLAHLADKMRMSRQHLTALLAELAESTIRPAGEEQRLKAAFADDAGYDHAYVRTVVTVQVRPFSSRAIMTLCS